MWTLVFRKIINNKWMMLCLLCGFIIVVAMVSSVPLYTGGILQRMLTRDLESYQLASSRYPGSYASELNLLYSTDMTQKKNTYDYFRLHIEDQLLPALDVPVIASTNLLTSENMQIDPADERLHTGQKTYYKLQAMRGLPAHTTLVSGRMYNPGPQEGGVYEAVISEQALKELKLSVGVDYETRHILDDDTLLKLRIVGVFTVADAADPFWYYGLHAYENSMFMDYDDYVNELLVRDNARVLSKSAWFYALDYHTITIEGLPALMERLDTHTEFYGRFKNALTFRMPTIDIMRQYEERASQLTLTLWIILVPMFVMLCFYIFMVSSLIVKSEENEIAVMRSRGASPLQIFSVYLLQGLVLGGLSLLAGPPLGYLLCSVLGSSNGFLDFIQRTSLPLRMSPTPYLYSLIAVVLFLITMLLPAYRACRTTIVEQKRRRGRRGARPLWQKIYLDFITLGVAVYGLTQYERLNRLILHTGESGAQLQFDPLLFLISSLFILGAGLLFLRIYPYLVRLLFTLGKRFWPPTLYASLLQVGRSSGQEQFLMLFLVLSVAIGIFNANSARTLNQNAEDKIRYSIGADAVLDVYWQSNEQDLMADVSDSGGLMSARDKITYVEPPFFRFAEIPGVEHAAKVYLQQNGIVSSSDSALKSIGKTMIMGIEPASFGQAAWFRSDLLPHHFYAYLNLIADAPKGVLVSSSLRDKLKLKVGDPININWGSQNGVECTVYAFIDYWPPYNPHEGMAQGQTTRDLVVANLSYLQARMVKEPYEVWIKKAPGVTDTQLNEALAASKIPLEGVRYAGQEIIAAKNDPMLQGLNGMLTLSFIITMLISAIGFLIYWILSIRGRALQFGIFRAMGLRLRAVLGMIVTEQVLISVSSILVGIVLGGITSDLFVPMMQMIYSAAEQVPPFVVTALRSDYYKIYAIIILMLILGIAILIRLISRIKVVQALKLGED